MQCLDSHAAMANTLGCFTSTWNLREAHELHVMQFAKAKLRRVWINCQWQPSSLISVIRKMLVKVKSNQYDCSHSCCALSFWRVFFSAWNKNTWNTKQNNCVAYLPKVTLETGNAQDSLKLTNLADFAPFCSALDFKFLIAKISSWFALMNFHWFEISLICH